MLKLMTLNINYYGEAHGAWPARRVLIQEAITAANPDIIALQAVRKSPRLFGGADQAAQVAESLPEHQHVLFHPAMEFDGDSSGGSAFISRLRLTERSSRALSLQPRLEDNSRRAVLGARVEAGCSLFIANAHFSWVESQAMDNVREVLAFVRPEPGPAIIVGDMNSAPESAPMQELCRAGWTDAWSLLRRDQPGYTFEAGRLFTRIDYFWVSPELKGRLRSIVTVSMRDEENQADLSDHLGLIAGIDT